MITSRSRIEQHINEDAQQSVAGRIAGLEQENLRLKEAIIAAAAYLRICGLPDVASVLERELE